MTKNTEPTTETTEHPQEPQEPAQEHQEAPEPTEDQSEAQEVAEGGPNAEAAKYRRRLRDAEAERDQIRDAAAQVRHDQLTGQLAGALRHPGDFFALTGTTIEDYLTDGLEIDQDKVTERLDQFRQERPDLTHRTELAHEGETVSVGPELQKTITDAVNKFSRR